MHTHNFLFNFQGFKDLMKFTHGSQLGQMYPKAEFHSGTTLVNGS